jgi:cytochrome P450
MLLERYVPAEGLTLPDGTTVPGGTKVGINPYVVGRNKDVWGEDADEFRPERWLQKDSEGDGEYAERLRVFNASDLAFGAGSRICMGRHFSMIETYKLIATLVNRYDMELTDPNKEWQVAGVWFPRQKGIVCNLSRRS